MECRRLTMMCLRHGDGALGETNGHDHGQHLGGQADGHGQGEEQRLAPVALGEPVDHEDKRDHDEDEADHQPGKLADAAIEARRLLLLDDGVGHAAEVGSQAGGHHDGGGGPTFDAGAEIADIAQLQRRPPGGVVPTGELLDGE